MIWFESGCCSLPFYAGVFLHLRNYCTVKKLIEKIKGLDQNGKQSNNTGRQIFFNTWASLKKQHSAQWHWHYKLNM